MKFLSATALLVCAAPLSVAAQSLPFFGSSQSPIQTKEIKYVEGNNPLQYCQEDTAGDILQIGSVDLTPNPPLPYVSPAHPREPIPPSLPLLMLTGG